MQLSKPRVVIIGGGFGGLTAAKSLKKAKVDVVLVEKTNYHLFQPLLYQVATAALSPGDIAAPLRHILSKYPNVQVIMNEAISINKEKMTVEFKNDSLSFDYLILSPGNRHSYFGNDNWEKFAPGLKDLKDALNIRERILLSFENAVGCYNTPESKKYLTFVIVGGGPTGVELAGSIAEVGLKTMLPDFPILKYGDIKVILLEAGENILSSYSSDLSLYAKNALIKLGVDVLLNTKVLNINDKGVNTTKGFIETLNVFWAAGNIASPLLQTLDTKLDQSGRAIVNFDLSIPGFQNIFVIGDAARVEDEHGNLLPGVAPVANQEAEYIAKNIKSRINHENRKPFFYKDKGSLATIGMAKAIAQFKKSSFTGFFAWLLWSSLHIFFLINFRTKLRVFFEWCWYYLTNQPGARLIIYNKNKIGKSQFDDFKD